MPGKRCSRCAAIRSSRGTNRALYGSALLGSNEPDAWSWFSITTNRGSSGGTLTRANCSSPVLGLTTTTARLSESPEMYGNGWAGSTASGVRTGNTCSRNITPSISCSAGDSSSHRTRVMPSSASFGRTSLTKTRACRAISSCAPARDLLEHLARLQAGRRTLGQTGRDPSLEPGDAHHEELVQVAGEDGQEAGPFEQRQRRVLGEGEHPLVELQPADLAVQEPVGRQLHVGVVGCPDELTVGAPRDEARERRSRRSRPSAPSGRTGCPPTRCPAAPWKSCRPWWHRRVNSG